MNPPVMPRSPLLAALIVAPLLALASCNAAPAEAPPLQGAAIGGPFELVDKDGRTVRWDDFRGRWSVFYFGYAWCPDVCPFDVQRMMAGFRQWAAANPELAVQVQPVFVTIDPARDTQDKVGEYAARFGPELLGLTGTAQQVDEAAQSFSVYYAKGEVRPDGSYLMDHSRAAYLMDPEGQPIALLPVEESADAVAAELAKWVR